jgi:flagellar hook-associated protein 1 FlgK
MANLLSSLLSSAGALSAYDQVLSVTQNNVANASTPGYVKQRQSLLALPFDPASGATGGVRAGEVQSTRSEYAEQSVRRQTVLLGESHQSVNSLTSLQSAFDISGEAGIAGALNHIFASFSAWAQSPTDTIARQNVIERANDVAQAFQQTAGALSNLSQDTDRQLQQTVDEVNRLAEELSRNNYRVMQGARDDAGLNAQMNATLEELSQYTEVTALWQPNGTVSVFMNGQTPLVLEDRKYEIALRPAQPANAAYPNARPSASIAAADGKDITSASTGGQLGALLEMRNRTLPSYLGDANQAGDLNTMALQFAKRVNELLQQGVVPDTNPAVNGPALFLYDAGNDTNIAATLRVDQTVTPDQLAPLENGPPPVSNGIPLALAALASPLQASDQVQGASYSEFYGDMAAKAGRLLNDATSRQEVQQSSLAQAKELRQEMSGVSLNEEATIMIQFQRAYEANARMITILNQLTEDMINILRV